MPRYTGAVDVGDVLTAWVGPWPVAWGIRFGAWLAHNPAPVDHVVTVHHVDAAGTWWGIEGRPGGVGWRDLTDILKHPLTSANNAQPKTREQRLLVATYVEQTLNTPYDWEAIDSDAREALHKSWAYAREWTDGEIPGHFVCSADADWAYERVGLANPGGNARTRRTTPAEWDVFNVKSLWKESL